MVAWVFGSVPTAEKRVGDLRRKIPKWKTMPMYVGKRHIVRSPTASCVETTPKLLYFLTRKRQQNENIIKKRDKKSDKKNDKKSRNKSHKKSHKKKWCPKKNDVPKKIVPKTCPFSKPKPPQKQTSIFKTKNFFRRSVNTTKNSESIYKPVVLSVRRR